MKTVAHTMEHWDTAVLLSPVLSRRSLEPCWHYSRRGNMCSHVTHIRHLRMALWSTVQPRVAGLQPHQLLGILSGLASKGATGWVTDLGQENLQGTRCCYKDTGDILVMPCVFLPVWNAGGVCLLLITWYFLSLEENDYFLVLVGNNTWFTCSPYFAQF